MQTPSTVGIAIPAFRNIDNLRRCLLSVGRAAPSLEPHITIVDDSGTGEVATALRADFPQVRWIVHETNQGFGVSANHAVLASPAEIVILLNDDIELVNDPTDVVQQAFANDLVFAATFQSRQSDGRFREGAKRLSWPMGMPKILHNPKDQRPAEYGLWPSDYAVGGHAAYRKDRFAELAGFDELFAPFYWEDVDLCARAKQHGWRTIYLPDCVVTHYESGAIRSHHDRNTIRETVLRNRLLFAWRHLPRCLKPFHGLALMFRLLESYWSADPVFRRAYAEAKAKMAGQNPDA
jgi:GT2 family glycosyltransferase